MKFIHCADLHIDSKMESNFTTEQAKERKEEILRAYEYMVDFAVRNDVKVIMIAGDLFDKSKVGKRAKRRVMEQIYNNENIDFLYLKGNHDYVDILDDTDHIPSNLKFFNEQDWTTYSYGNIDVTGIEVTQNNHNEIAEKLVLEKSKLNVVMLHGQETKYNSDSPEAINISGLKNHYIDYLALGHVHQYKKERLDERGIYCYCGCLAGRGFDECGQKGFVLLDVNDNAIEDKFIPLDTRQFHEISVDVSRINSEYASSEIIKTMEEKCDAIPQSDIVKFVLEGEADVDTDIDLTRIEREFEGRFYFVKIYNKTKPKVDYAAYANDKSLKGEFVRIMQKKDMDDEKKNEIIKLGLKALKGEEIEI